MTQSQQQSERKFIAVHFRGIQQLTRERTAIEIHGAAVVEVLASLPGPLPVPDELEPDSAPRAPASARGAVSLLPGGEAARAAHVYAAQGGMAAFAGTVGTDPAGDLILRWLSEGGVDVSRVSRAGATPVRLVLAPTGQTALAVSGSETPAALGAVARALADETPASASNGAPHRHATSSAGAATGEAAASTASTAGTDPRTLLLAGYPYVGALRGAPARDLLRGARAAGQATVLSFSPIQLGGDGPALTPEELADLLPEADLVCGAQPELRRATRRSDVQEAARALLDAGAKAVLARRGADGATVYRAGSSGLVREDTATPAAAVTVAGISPLRLATAFGAVYDAGYLLALAANDTNPIRFAAQVAAAYAAGA